jgi:hypothetical protein
LRETARLKPAGPALDRRGEERERLTVKLPRSLIDRLRNAVYWTPGLTMTGFLAKCIASGVAGLEKDRGDQFPQREQALRPGRPKTRVN